MKKIFYILIICLILFSGNFVFANLSSLNVLSDDKSIHQTELEKYKDYRIKESNIGIVSNGNVSLSPDVSKVVYGFFPYWMGDTYANFQWNLITHLAYFSIEVNSDGSLGDKHGWPNNTLLNLAHQNGVKVVLTAQNFSSSDLSTLLSNATYRNNLINNLLNEVKSTSADGINIDFENVDSAMKTNLTTFITDLNNTFKISNSSYHIAIDVPAVDWSDAFDENALALNSDGLMIMAYDYHWQSGSTAGPIAPYDDSSTWGNYNVVSTLETYLSLTNNNRQKLILGVPYYGYDWEVSADTVPANTIGTGEAKTYAENRLAILNYSRIWDNDSKTPYYKYGSFRQTWYEDEESLQYKYDLVNDNALLGIGIWALGYDNGYADLWNKISENFLEPKTVAVPVGGDYKKYKKITLTATDTNGISGIYYTLDGSTPTISSTKYSSAFRIFNDKTLKFFSVDSLGNQEIVRTENYNIVYNDKKFDLRKGLKNIALEGKLLDFKFKKIPNKPTDYWFKIARIAKKPSGLNKSKTLKGYWKIESNLNKIKSDKKFKIKMVFKFRNRLLHGLKKKDLKLKFYNNNTNQWQTMPAVYLKKEKKFRIWINNFRWQKNKFAISTI
ncbi:MAG: glycosyl hydrolase family 18 protein [Patescibacteria group bacterium]|jgi:spore germination protein YaaH